jgi:uncharacterized protein (TIGR02147 family)
MNLSQQQTPAGYLRQVFLERRAHNAAYSTRAFARDLGISQALLSLVLNEKRPLTVKQAAQISILLNLSPDDSRQFLETTLMSLPMNSKGLKKIHQMRPRSEQKFFADLSVEKFKAISQWYHVAILDLSTTKNFRADPNWIASRLGIATVEARDALQRLLKLGFLEKKGSQLKKANSKLFFVTERSDAAVRSFHKQMMTKAQAKLDETSDAEFSLREISSITIAARKDRIAEAKTKIKKFQKELSAFLSAGDCDEVFQMNIQLFRLTKDVKEEN